jgi:hypothetical protein
MTYEGQAYVDQIIKATVDFQAHNTDRDANMISAYVRAPGRGPTFYVMVFYNGPTPPPRVFDKFLAIPRTAENVKTRTYLDLIDVISVPYENSAHLR